MMRMPWSRSGASSSPRAQVFGGVVVLVDGKLDQGNVRFGIDGLHDGEGAVVVASCGVEAGFQAALFEQLFDGSCEGRLAGSVVADAVGVFGKAAIVEHHGRSGGGGQEEAVGLPVAGDHQDGAWDAAHLTPHVQEGLFELGVGRGLFGQPGPWSAAMREEVGG